MQFQNVFSFFKDNKLNFSAIFVSLSLVVYPATVLLVPKVNGLIIGLFALSGLYLLFRYRDKSTQVNQDEKLFYLSLGIFFLVSLFITLYGGFAYKAIGKYLHLLLAIPIYIYFRHVGIKLLYLWYGLVAGAIVVAGIAIYDVWITDTPRYWGNGDLRAMGITHPIIFGDLALVMGVMSIAGLGWFKQRSAWQALLPVIALLCGVLASVLSIARGGWVAVPFLVLVFFWYIKSRFSFKFKIIIAAAVIVLIGVIYAVPQTKVKHHVDRTITSLQQYGDSEIKSIHRRTSVGTRLEMWQASWKIFLDNPVMGVGWGHYKEQAQAQVDQGLRNKSAATFDHPHSEYFSALAHGGILGFSVLMLLFLTPAWIFIKYIKYGKSVESRRLALAGLVLVVAYMAFGISEPMLYRSRSVGFFALYLAIFMAGIYQEEDKAISRKS